MTVRDIALTTNGDWKIEKGDFVMVSDLEAITQSVLIRLQFFKDEWFADLDAGIPYFDSVFVKTPDLGALRSVFRQAILDTPGVLDVLELELDLDGSTRTLNVSFRASTDLGEISV